MLNLKVENQNIQLISATPLGNPLVANSSGEYECIFEFDDSWNGFINTAVFSIKCNNKEECYEVKLIEDNKCIIPIQVLKNDSYIRIGVYGVKGDIQRPTVFTPYMYVRTGASPCGKIPDPEPSIYLQIVKIMEETKAVAESLHGVPEGGLAGQVLAKKSDEDYDTEWVEQSGGGSGGSSEWRTIKNKPFDEINPNEMEVIGLEGNRQLGIKEISTDKVIGLDNKLNEIDTKQPKGDYALNSAIPTKVSELENDSEYVNQIALNAIDAKVEANTEAIALKAEKTEIPTKTSQLTNDSDFATNANLAKKLDLTGGTMQGKIDMANFGIANLLDGVANGDAVNKKQLDTAIAGIGTVFNLKGSKPTFGELPEIDNKIGDVWFIEDESVGYIWIEKSGVPQWEKFGPTIDLSGYLTKDGLLSTTGSETKNAMSQDATTKELKKKLDSTKLPTAIDDALAQAKASGEFDGKNGYSPTVEVAPVQDGNQVTITDATGPKTFKVKNGKDGKDAQFGYEESADTTVELKANVFHVFTSPTATISVTTAPSMGYAEYSFKFTTASSGGNLSIPAEFKWNGDKVPELKPNMTYQVVLFSGTAYISGGVAV